VNGCSGGLIIVDFAINGFHMQKIGWDLEKVNRM
jgi:hypothetical protein